MNFVKTSPSPGKELELPENSLVFGLKCFELLASYDLDSQSLKMCQTSLDLGLTESSPTLPVSGMMRNGRLYRQEMLAHPTCENDYGSLPTPRANEIDMSQHALGIHGMNYIAKDGREWGMNLTTYAKLFPTPGDSQIRRWRTPDAHIGERGAKSKENYERTLKNHHTKITLNDQVRHFPTPQARDYKGGSIKHDRLLDVVTGSLNPNWVEWLMGYPIGWTDLNHSATPSSRK